MGITEYLKKGQWQYSRWLTTWILDLHMWDKTIGGVFCRMAKWASYKKWSTKKHASVLLTAFPSIFGKNSCSIHITTLSGFFVQKLYWLYHGHSDLHLGRPCGRQLWTVAAQPQEIGDRIWNCIHSLSAEASTHDNRMEPPSVCWNTIRNMQNRSSCPL